jgi:hypothetical protein
MTAETTQIIAAQIRATARAEAFEHGILLRYEHVARSFLTIRSRFIAEQCELAGFPVWTSVPEEAMRP